MWSYPAAGRLTLGESTLYIAGSDGTLTAIGLGIPDLYVPESVLFEPAEAGKTVTKTVTLSNVGDEPLEVTGIESSSTAFKVQKPALPHVIAAHESMPLDIAFTLAEGGDKKGTLTVTSSDPNEAAISSVLTGRSSAIHTITAGASSGGRIDPSGFITVSDEGSAVFMITPDDTYNISDVLVDGVSVGNPSWYRFDEITRDHSLTALFVPKPYYTVSVSAGEGGQITPAGRVITHEGEMETFTVVPDKGFKIRELLVDGISVGKRTSYSFTNISAGHSISVSFDRDTDYFGIQEGNFRTQAADGYGRTALTTLNARVMAQKLVKVPAGYFLAFPIEYKMTMDNGAVLSTSNWTEFFVPYIGTVQSVDSDSTAVARKFATNSGSVRTPPRVITGVTPSSVASGSTVTIEGHQFGAQQSGGGVTIGGVEADTILSWSDEQIVCLVPEAAASGNIVVDTNIWPGNEVPVTIE